MNLSLIKMIFKNHFVLITLNEPRGSGGRAGYNDDGTGGGQREPAELQATQGRLLWRTGDVARRRQWRTGATGHRGSP
jgi:hypothetical protein